MSVNKAFWGAYKKGIAAGISRNYKNPYANDGKTFSTAFYRAWKRGYRHGREGCDCQSPPMTLDQEGLFHVSNGCPVHGD